MKTIKINLYTFEELNNKAKERAIENHYNFLLSLSNDLDIDDEDYNNISYTEEEVIENIIANEYIFFSDGSLTNCTTYTGKHPKAGITEMDFKGITYTI
jgi:hypothetical protein